MWLSAFDTNGVHFRRQLCILLFYDQANYNYDPIYPRGPLAGGHLFIERGNAGFAPYSAACICEAAGRLVQPR
jgi:hypothetical protein